MQISGMEKLSLGMKNESVVYEAEVADSLSSSASSMCSSIEYPREMKEELITELSRFRKTIPYLNQDSPKAFFNCSSQILYTTKVSEAISDFFLKRAMSPDAEFVVFEQIVEETRALYADLLGLSENECNNVCFTRDSSEALHIIQRSFRVSEGDSVLMVDNEFQHNNLSWLGFQQENPGLKLRFVDTKGDKNFVATAEKLEPYVDESVKLIVLSYTMYHSGLQNDIQSITRAFNKRGIHTIVNLTQDVGFHKVDVHQLGISGAYLSTFKGLFIPQGLGILYMNDLLLEQTRAVPPFVNIKSMSRFDNDAGQIGRDYTFGIHGDIHTSCLKFEHSNKPNLQIYSSWVMLQYLKKELPIEETEKYLSFLRTRLETVLAKYGVEVYGGDVEGFKSPNIVVTSISNPEWMKFFREKGVIVSQFRHVTRFSIGIYNTVEDIDMLEAVLAEGVRAGISYKQIEG